ncbi:hypothetical protein JRO89_XSUnG0122800 [Xanthoceras sorbifolium]|uniref:Reverse transcriptase zinc-binding domain-containing protein n=1 Tax=Xanthoceras sorbifolium TaxID=99658 RepID=A0ABQ8GYD9_9ROSI|nr:hypothetical protein JRO89_XSUnG0122800 [Xanthoceras sorbifolium]
MEKKMMMGSSVLLALTAIVVMVVMSANWVKKVKDMASNPADRREICECFKKAAPAMGVDPAKAEALPGLCGVQLPFPIKPDIDCTKYEWISIKLLAMGNSLNGINKGSSRGGSSSAGSAGLLLEDCPVADGPLSLTGSLGEEGVVPAKAMGSEGGDRVKRVEVMSGSSAVVVEDETVIEKELGRCVSGIVCDRAVGAVRVEGSGVVGEGEASVHDLDVVVAGGKEVGFVCLSDSGVHGEAMQRNSCVEEGFGPSFVFHAQVEDKKASASSSLVASMEVDRKHFKWKCVVRKGVAPVDTGLSVSCLGKRGDSSLLEGVGHGMEAKRSRGDSSGDLTSEASSSSSVSGSSWWKFLWGLNVPAKVRLFVWRACCYLLPTKFNLAAHKVPVGVDCLL